MRSTQMTIPPAEFLEAMPAPVRSAFEEMDRLRGRYREARGRLQDLIAAGPAAEAADRAAQVAASRAGKPQPSGGRLEKAKVAFAAQQQVVAVLEDALDAAFDDLQAAWGATDAREAVARYAAAQEEQELAEYEAVISELDARRHKISGWRALAEWADRFERHPNANLQPGVFLGGAQVAGRADERYPWELVLTWLRGYRDWMPVEYAQGGAVVGAER